MLHDFSQSEAVIRGEFLAMLSAWQSPSVLYRAKIFPFPDGDAWCCLYGENIQDGVCAFGATPAEAARNFDWYVWHGKPVPEANLDAERETEAFLEKKNANLIEASNLVLKVKADQDEQLATLQAQLADRDAMILQMGEQAAVLAKENMAVKAQLRQVEGQSQQQAEEAVIVFAKYTTLRQLMEVHTKQLTELTIIPIGCSREQELRWTQSIKDLRATLAAGKEDVSHE